MKEPRTPNPIDRDAFRIALAGEVRSQVARLGVKQSSLLTVVGLGQNALSERMNGKTEWRATELIDLCDYLGLDLGQVLGTAKRVVREAEARRDPLAAGVKWDGLDLAAATGEGERALGDQTSEGR